MSYKDLILLLSKCPNCRSTFEIDEKQLSVADGLVRCGACLHVFNGRQEQKTESPILSQEQESSFKGIDKELDQIEAQIDALTKKRNSPRVSQSIDADLADFANLTQAFQSAPEESSSIPNPASGLDTFDITEGKPEHFQPTEDYLESDWEAKPSIQETHSPELSTPQSVSQGLKRRSKLEDDISDFFADSDTIHHNGSGADQLPQSSLRPNEKQGFKKKATSLDSIAIDDEPLSLNSEATEVQKIPYLKYGMIGLCIALLSCIAYGISQFDSLSQDPYWRPKLAGFCGIFQCTLKPTHSTQFIKLTSSNMAALGDQLEVNAVIYNTNAHFDMPFPDVVVLFYDLDQKLIAELEVRPDEYRQGEIARMKHLPTNTSAHITFLLSDPTNGTLNYEITFRYPKNL